MGSDNSDDDDDSDESGSDKVHCTHFRRKRQLFGSYIDREFFIDNLLVQIHCIIEMIRWTGLARWEFEFLFSRQPYIYLPSLGVKRLCMREPTRFARAKVACCALRCVVA